MISPEQVREIRKRFSVPVRGADYAQADVTALLEALEQAHVWLGELAEKAGIVCECDSCMGYPNAPECQASPGLLAALREPLP